MNETDSRVINSLRFPLAVMVVAIHSYIAIDGWVYNSVASQGIGSNVAQFFMIAISHVLTHVAVPTFFLISGYLFFNNFDNGNTIVWRKKMLSRVKTLLIPYVIWVALYILYSMIMSYKSIVGDGIWEWYNSHGGLSMFWCSETWNLDRKDIWGQPDIASSPILVPFWFLRNLIVCVVLSPLFYSLFKKSNSNITTVIALSVLSFLYFTQTSLRVPGLSVSSMFYFGIGAALSLWNRSLVETFSMNKKVVWPIFVILTVIEISLYGHNTMWGNIIYPFFVFVGVWSIIALKPQNGGGQNYTFFIYAFHIFALPFVKLALSKLLRFITGETTVNNICFANKYPLLIMFEYCLTIAIVVLICIAGCLLIRRYTPALSKLICGR